MRTDGRVEWGGVPACMQRAYTGSRDAYLSRDRERDGRRLSRDLATGIHGQTNASKQEIAWIFSEMRTQSSCGVRTGHGLMDEAATGHTSTSSVGLSSASESESHLVLARWPCLCPCPVCPCPVPCPVPCPCCPCPCPCPSDLSIASDAGLGLGRVRAPLT